MITAIWIRPVYELADREPPNARWIVPAHRQGQIVEVAFANRDGSGDAGEGSLWMRRHDSSDGTTTYYRRTKQGRWTYPAPKRSRAPRKLVRRRAEQGGR